MDIDIRKLKLLDEKEQIRQVLEIVKNAFGDNGKDVIQVLSEEFIAFASEILVNNIPTLDGCLSVHKKVLWGMFQGKVFHNKPFIKMLRASSYAMIYYVLGDMPLTAAMKNMANNNINYFYLDPKGSYGDKNKKGATGASARYIECRLSEYSEDLLKGVEKNCVPTKRNYDNTEDEIIILPSMIPNILTNTSQSIAVGEASKIPSHNLISVCDSFISYIKTKDIDKSIDIIQCPDFIGIGGQIVYDKKTFENIYKTGKGSFTMLGKYKFNKEENILSIIEIPYVTYIEEIKKKVSEGYDKGLFKEIIDWHDGTDKDGLCLEIMLKKNTNIEQFVGKLRKYTPYESKFSCNFTVLDLDCKTPMLMSLEDIISKWIIHRHNCIKNETKYDLIEKNKRLHKLYGLKIINKDLDKTLEIIKTSKKESIALQRLIDYFDLTKEQAEYISTIRLLNINEEWIIKQVKDVEQLEIEIDKLNVLLNSPQKIDELIIYQLEGIKNKYGRERQTTTITEESSTIEIPESDLIEDFNCYISVSKENYLYKYLRRTDNFKLKDNDEIIKTESTSNKATLLIFTSLGNCHKLFLHDIQEKLPSQLGHYLPSLINLQQDEKIISVQVTRKYEGNLINIFSSGKLSKVSMQSFKTDQKRSMLKNAISIESPLVNQFIITDDIDIICKSSIDKVLITSTSQFNAKGSKNTNGDGLIKSKNDSTLVFCQPLDNINKDKLNIEYYKGSRNTVGSYLKKEHIIKLLTK